MTSKNSEWVLVFNGEIYNHLELRDKLQSVKWQGHSDTETLVELIASWGFDEAIKMTVGMFAIAAWNKRNRKLYLARDRMGEKPIYYCKHEGRLYVASELKAFHALAVVAGLNQDALQDFFRFGYIIGNKSIWKNARRLSPACIIIATFPINSDIFVCPEYSYWKPHSNIMSRPYAHFQEAIQQTEDLIQQSVSAQMVSDVPLGAFLSGGIDSSLIVAIMQNISHRPIKTFTIGFDDTDYNESHRAEKIAKHLRTDHTTLNVTAADLISVVDEIAEVWDEPFADESQIPTLVLSKLTRNHVKVAISGDGGDELFGGYERYYRLLTIRRWQKLLPGFAWKFTASALSRLPVDAVNFIGRQIGSKSVLLGDRLSKLLPLLAENDRRAQYSKLVSHWHVPPLKLSIPEKTSQIDMEFPRFADTQMDDLSYMQSIDQRYYLPDDILTKVDRASMSASLEVRAPFLDHRLVEHSWFLPRNMKQVGRIGKVALRTISSRYIPPELVNGPKSGFGIPLAKWLRGPLKKWAFEAIKDGEVANDQLLDFGRIWQAWSEHQSSTRNRQTLLWSVIVYSAWTRRWLR